MRHLRTFYSIKLKLSEFSPEILPFYYREYYASRFIKLIEFKWNIVRKIEVDVNIEIYASEKLWVDVVFNLLKKNILFLTILHNEKKLPWIMDLPFMFLDLQNWEKI